MIKDLHIRKNIIILRNHNIGEDETLPIASNEIHVWWGRTEPKCQSDVSLGLLLITESIAKNQRFFKIDHL
ncbi:MAG: hypothetical protein R3A45_03205 [Bdellovibrionota bacterium]